MTWVRVDDDMPWHRKFRQAGDLRALCLALDVTGICHSAKYLTDGFVADADLPGVLDVIPRNRRITVLGLLVEINRWSRDNQRGGYWIRNYLKFNPSRSDVEQERKRNLEKSRRWRERLRGGDRSPPGDDTGDESVRTGVVTGENFAPSPRGLEKPKGQASLTPPARTPSPDPAAASPSLVASGASSAAEQPNNGQPPTKAQRAALRAALERKRQDDDAEEVSQP